MIHGTVRNENGQSVAGASVELKDERFETVFCKITDEEGSFSFPEATGFFPFLTAVRGYTEEFLEYWCQNLDASADTELTIRIGQLEVYGLHAFRVKGGAKSLLIYFRPMSLPLFREAGGVAEPTLDICPLLKETEILVDGHPVEVILVNRVREAIDAEHSMGAYLLQVKVERQDFAWKRIDVTIRDEDGNLGAATLMREEA